MNKVYIYDECILPKEYEIFRQEYNHYFHICVRSKGRENVFYKFLYEVIFDKKIMKNFMYIKKRPMKRVHFKMRRNAVSTSGLSPKIRDFVEKSHK